MSLGFFDHKPTNIGGRGGREDRKRSENVEQALQAAEIQAWHRSPLNYFARPERLCSCARDLCCRIRTKSD